MKRALQQQFPQFTLPYETLLAEPSKLSQLPSGLWVKDDSQLNESYGGNKVRKLEYLFADAKRKGANDIFSFGFAGSNFATAAAIFAKPLGFKATSMLLPQLNEPYVGRNLRASAASEANFIYKPNTMALAIAVITHHLRRWLSTGRQPYWFPAGGSKPVGVVGFVSAAFELAAQWPQRQAPEKVYVAVGSMGSAVGLAIGFALMHWPTKVQAVRVIETRYANPKAARKLAIKVLKLLDQEGLPVPNIESVMQRLEFRDEFFGGTYGRVTKETKAAAEEAAKEGLTLDTTYSAKAYAAVLADLNASKAAAERCVFWNTHNGISLVALAAQADSTSASTSMPAGLRAYL